MSCERRSTDIAASRSISIQQVRSSVQGTDVRSSNLCLAVISSLKVPCSMGEVSENQLLRRHQAARAQTSHTKQNSRRIVETGGGFGWAGAQSLFGCLVDRVAGFVLRGCDVDLVLLGGGGNEAPNAVGLPVGGLHDLGGDGTLDTSDHLQDFR